MPFTTLASLFVTNVGISRSVRSIQVEQDLPDTRIFLFLFVRLMMQKAGGLLIFVAVSTLGFAQSFVLDLPLPSQRAEITQRVGVTDITIRYHRPLAGDRKIWDGVVPYGKVWRGGANENTTITFTDNVMIEGKPLDKGTYGLHMIPTPTNGPSSFRRMQHRGDRSPITNQRTLFA